MGNKRKLFGTKKSNTTAATQAKRQKNNMMKTAAEFQPKTGIITKDDRFRKEKMEPKYKLLPSEPEPKRLSEPTDYSVVGGKPLRKRKEPVPEEPKEKKKKSRVNADGTPATNKAKPKKENKEVKQKTDGRGKGRPRKHEVQLFTIKPASENTDTNLQPECVRIKTEEVDLPVDHDPLNEEDQEYLIEIKEENPDANANEEQNLSEAGHSAPEINVIMPTFVPIQPSTSKANTATIPVMTVVLDDIQIFANSVAEQLRAMPINRALLLQLDIQNMLDNEKQIMMHES